MNKPESRFARHRRIAAEVYREPRTLRTHLREGFVAVWISRGGGFYGLGWIVTFLILELQFFGFEKALRPLVDDWFFGTGRGPAADGTA